MRRLGIVAVSLFALVALPGTASADVLFDQADADELAATLDEAYQVQRVCYGWSVTIDNVGVTDESIGSNFGAGRSTSDAPAECSATVEFTARITWTSESSESEDSGSYSVFTEGGGSPTTADLDSLELISVDGLIGDNGDAEVYKAVSALPLLAADAGIADPIEATPAPENAAGDDAQPTNSPGSDFWRNSGMMILWGSLILLAGGVFAWWVIRTDRSRRPVRSGRPRPVRAAPVGPPEEQIPAYVPENWSKPAEPEEPADPSEPETVAESAKAEEPAEAVEDPESPPESASEDDPDEPPRPKS